MSYDESWYRRDEWLDKLSEELYEDHRERAVSEFTWECFRRYYLAHPETSLASDGYLLKGELCFQRIRPLRLHLALWRLRWASEIRYFDHS